MMDWNLKLTLRPEVVLSEPFFDGKTTYYHAKDTLTKHYFRLRPREYFIFTHMDGSRTLDELFAVFDEHFGTQTSEKERAGLLTYMAQKGLIQEWSNQQVLDKLKQEAVRLSQTERISLSKKRLFLFNPQKLPMAILRPLSILKSYTSAVLLAVLFMGISFLFCWHFDQLWVPTSFSEFKFTDFLMFFSLVIIFLVSHELAHSFACIHAGGTSEEVGINLSKIMPQIYARVESTFLNKKSRIWIAFAGIQVNIIMLTGIAILLFGGWLLSLRTPLMVFFIFGMVTVTLSSGPFFGSDGLKIFKEIYGHNQIENEARLRLFRGMSIAQKNNPLVSRVLRRYWIYVTFYILASGGMLAILLFKASLF